MFQHMYKLTIDRLHYKNTYSDEKEPKKRESEKEIWRERKKRKKLIKIAKILKVQ